MLIGAEAAGKLHDKYSKSMCKTLGLTLCPKCQNMWEHQEGKIDLNVKDEKGVVLTKYRINFT